MNEDKSVRYHRRRRRAAVVSAAVGAGYLALLVWTGAAVWLARAFGAGTAGVAAFVVVLAIGYDLVLLPLAFYRGYHLERAYGLSSESLRQWAGDHVKGMAITTALAVGAAEIVIACARGAGVWWWLVAAGVFAAAAILLTNLAPLVIFPLFYRFTPLAREGLRDRLLALSAKAGVRVLGAFEWELGSRTRRANAALVGLGATRRILLSDTLLEAYSDDEIEVVLAHELAHHVHHDIRTGLAFESLVVVAGLGAADVTVRLLAPRTGVTGPDEPAALPLVALAAAVISVLLLPLANALSRRNERRADRFALALTKHPAAFISAIRRLGAQNLAEEHPSRLTYHLFHTHPTVEERVRAAATTQPESGIADQQSLITNP